MGVLKNNAVVSKNLLAQLVFGVDTLIGLGAYILMSFAFEKDFSIWFLLLSGIFAYLPDFDLLIFFLLSKEQRRWGHWRLGFHHPMFFVPLSVLIVFFLSWKWAPDSAVYLTVLAFMGIMGHFIHDSTKDGLHWFSPITRDGGWSFDPLRWARIKISYRDGIEIVPQREVAKIYERIAQKAVGEGEVGSRLEKVTWVHVYTFMLCITCLGVMVVTAR